MCLNRATFMATLSTRIRRRINAARRTFRELKMIGKGLLSTAHPIQVHIIPMRRCNLSCAYCNEYDDVSKPVPVETMYGRIDRLAELGTTIVTISGGEPLLASGMRQQITGELLGEKTIIR